MSIIFSRCRLFSTTVPINTEDITAGPFLFGEWSIADAFYTPVATRFRSYGVRLSDYGDHGPAGIYCETLLEQPEFLEWEKGATAERAAQKRD